MRALHLCIALSLSGCASSVAITGSQLTHRMSRPALGIRLGQQFQFADQSFAFGTESELLSRTDSFDSGNQWRLRALFGYSDWPQAFESFAGVEAFATLSAARIYVQQAAGLRALAGARVHLPMRLGGRRPAWQADELVSARWLLVPSIGFDYVIASKRPVFELSYGLAIRLQGWSGVMP